MTALFDEGVSQRFVFPYYIESTMRRIKVAPGRFYLPELDGLRFFAFLAVFLSHAASSPLRPSSDSVWLTLVSGTGRYGVDLFFTMSAYLLTTLMLREQELYGQVRVKAFYARRILRIWPLYYTFLLGLLCFQAISWSTFHPRWVIAYACFVSNLTSTGIYPGLAVDALWSLSVEEQFYLVWPLIVRLASSRRGVLVAGVAAWVISAGVRTALLASGTAPRELWGTGFARLDSIAAGVILAACLNGVSSITLSNARRVGLMSLGLLLWTTVAIKCHLFAASPGRVLGPALGYFLIALGCVAFFFAALGAQTWITSRPLVYFGRISYGLYVFHLPVLLILKFFLPQIHLAAFIALGLLVTLVVSTASYEWLEAPFLRLKKRFEQISSAPVV
jgi:peptidoglycan/LPS O-acetylase OafA/YrhL